MHRRFTYAATLSVFMLCSILLVNAAHNQARDVTPPALSPRPDAQSGCVVLPRREDGSGQSILGARESTPSNDVHVEPIAVSFLCDSCDIIIANITVTDAIGVSSTSEASQQFEYEFYPRQTFVALAGQTHIIAKAAIVTNGSIYETSTICEARYNIQRRADPEEESSGDVAFEVWVAVIILSSILLFLLVVLAISAGLRALHYRRKVHETNDLASTWRTRQLLYVYESSY